MKPLNKAIIDPLNFREKTGDVSFTYFYLLIEKHHIPQLHGEAPPELLFNRVVRSGIPSVNENSVSIQIEERNKKVEERTKQQKKR
jgi:hypothetical protein